MGMGKTGFGLVKEAVQTEGLYRYLHTYLPHTHTHIDPSIPSTHIHSFVMWRVYAYVHPSISMWRGVFPTLVRDVPFSAIYWDLYERGKGLIRL